MGPLNPQPPVSAFFARVSTGKGTAGPGALVAAGQASVAAAGQPADTRGDDSDSERWQREAEDMEQAAEQASVAAAGQPADSYGDDSDSELHDAKLMPVARLASPRTPGPHVVGRRSRRIPRTPVRAPRSPARAGKRRRRRPTAGSSDRRDAAIHAPPR